MRKRSILLAVAWLAAGCGGGAKTNKGGPSAGTGPVQPPVKIPYAVVVTSKGKIVLKLLPDLAPKTVAAFIGLATGTTPWTDPRTGAQSKASVYRGSSVHRVIPGFLIQGGSPRGELGRNPGIAFPDEANPARGFDKGGLVGIANDGSSAGSCEFFITLAPAPWLTGKHTLFAELVDGGDVVERISQVPAGGPDNDAPLAPVTIDEIRVEYH